MNKFNLFNEAGTTPAEITWTNKNGLFGYFIINEQKFDIEVTELNNPFVDNIYQFKFYRDNSTNMFNDVKYAYKVIPTIKNALRYAIKILEPSILVFASSDNSKTRKSMYKLEAVNVAHELNYFDLSSEQGLKKYGFESDVIFGIYKDQKLLDLAFKEYE